MAKFELTDLDLSKMTDEQRLKITQGIVEDLLRALNVGNYSLIWRYISEDLSEKLTPQSFSALHQELIEKYNQLSSAERIESSVEDKFLVEKWSVATELLTTNLLETNPLATNPPTSKPLTTEPSTTESLENEEHAKLTLSLRLGPNKEFLVIEGFSIKETP